jgi:hypothetical protein
VRCIVGMGVLRSSRSGALLLSHGPALGPIAGMQGAGHNAVRAGTG